MTIRRTALAGLAVPVIAAALAVSGCGSDSNSGGAYGGNEASSTRASGGNEAGAGRSYGGAYGGSESSAPATTGGGAVVVSIGSTDEAGKVLVDSKGLTLYYFEKDRKGSGKSACYGACASAWPPLTTSGEASVKGGADAALIGSIKRSDGTSQVTYAGWPLYTYVADTKPGEANGTDLKAFGGTWYPLHSNGEKAGE